VNSERVLITGATGFIGRALTRALLAQGATVTAFAREKPGRRLGEGVPAGAEIVEVDLRYAAGVKRAVEAAQPTLAVHLAAVGVTDPFLPIGEALRGNLETTINLLKAVSGRCRVVVARTPGELDSINTYAAAKAAAWQFCRMFQRTQGWPITAVMPFQVYGPGQPAKTVVGAALSAARAGEDFPTTPGEQMRDWIYIDDAVAGIIAASRADAVDGETIELGTGLGTPVREVVEKVFKLAGQGRPLIGALPQRPGEAPSQIANADRTEQLISWRARVSLDEGLRKVIETSNDKRETSL
jgi:nucleoside-diphosphate-sugar epimerase